MLKESLRMENARQETLAAQVGARVEGNAIVAPDVGERAPLGHALVPRPRSSVHARTSISNNHNEFLPRERRSATLWCRGHALASTDLD